MSRKTRKLIWSVPLVATLAMVGALALFITLAPNDASAQQGEEAPGMPTELMLRALDQVTIELTWKVPSDDTGGSPDGYRIDYSADGLIWYSLAPNHSALKYVDNKDLEASEERHYRIFAFNTGGSSRLLGPMSTMTTASTKPEAPTALVVNPGVDTTGADAIGDANEEHLVVSWDPPVDPPGAPVTTFRLQVSKNSSSGFFDLKGAEELKAKDVCEGDGASRVCTHTNVDLFENNEQWYRVYASNSIGESPASEIRGDKTDEGTEPTMPLNLRAALSTAGKMVLYWDRPAETTPLNTGKYDPPGAPITGYFIQGGPVGVDSPGGAVPFVQPNGNDLEGTADTDPQAPSINQVVRYTAGTDVPLVDSIRGQLDNFAGAPNGTATQWGFRVMAINRVVERNVKDGTIAAGDGAWSDMIRVNNDPDLLNVLPKSKLEADRHTPSDRGRTGIELEWSVTGGVDGTTQYRVEYSEDRIDWTALPDDDEDVFAAPAPAGAANPEPTGLVINTATVGVHVGLTASTGYSYRVFAVQPDTAGAPSGSIYTEASVPVSDSTTTADRPDKPELVAPSAESETELSMTVRVDNSDEDGQAASGVEEVGFGELKGYRIEISDDGRDWTKYDTVMIGAKLDVVYSYSEKNQKVTTSMSGATDDTVDFRHTDLMQRSTRYYRASTVNNAPGKSAYSEATDPAVKGTTDAALTSDDPGGLVVKAKGRTATELFWNARADDIDAAKVETYQIEYSAVDDDEECAQEWMTAVEETETSATYYEHTGLMPGTGYCYRVFGINVVGTSTSFVGFGDDYATTYDADAQAMTYPTMVPGMPMNVEAMATSDTAITVSWTAPADNGGADITGYVLQRAYMGADDTMTDFMTIAATDAATWWNTLGCPMMNAAIPDDATPAAPADDADTDSPYCAMYGGLSADAKEEVDAVFDANYDTIMGTSHMDMGLMPETMYYYRVAAMNSVGRGEYSDGMDMAATEATNMAPTAGAAIAEQTVTADATVMVRSTITDADTDDTLTWSVESDMPTYATAEVDDMGMVTITGVAEGMATITVTATDIADETATQDIMVTVEAAGTALTATSRVLVSTSTFGNTKSISVTWDTTSIQNAEQIKVALFNSDVTALAQPLITINPANDRGGDTFSDVPSGTYYVTVASFRTGERHKLSLPLQEVTVE